MEKTLKEIANYVLGLLMGVAIGVSYMKAYPPSESKEYVEFGQRLHRHGLALACLGGQLSVIEGIGNSKDIRSCQEIVKGIE